MGDAGGWVQDHIAIWQSIIMNNKYISLLSNVYRLQSIEVDIYESFTWTSIETQQLQRNGHSEKKCQVPFTKSLIMILFVF